ALPISDYYPNYLYEHLDFDRSRHYYPISLLDIEASGDNRDGFVFRHEIDILSRRMEKDKFMIIFSDGLPSAEQYNQSGVIDTHEAVNEARSEEHTSELQSRFDLVCRLLLEKKKYKVIDYYTNKT